MGSIQNPGFGSTLKQLDLLKIFGLFFRTLWWPGFSAKQALNSKQSAKGYERIIQEILRRSGYFIAVLLRKRAEKPPSF